MMWKDLTELIKRSFTLVILVIIFGGAYLHSALLFSLFLAAALGVALVCEWPNVMPLPTLVLIPVSLIYPIAPTAILIWIACTFRATDFFLPLYPFAVCLAADSCGYLVGKLVGWHKICPSISPGKSWEGLVGGWMGVFAVHLLMVPKINLFAHSSLFSSTWFLLFWSLAMTVITLAGGFLMSYLKRRQGLKDAGSLLPGHGGLLDRSDSILFAGLVTLVLILLLAH